MMKIVKKLLVTVPIVGILNIRADEPVIKNNPFYVGVGLGSTDIIGSVNRKIHPSTTDNTIKLGNRETVTKLFMGYGFIPEKTPIYLGIEASYYYQLGNIKSKRKVSTLHTTSYETKISKKDGMGLHIKIGIPHQRALFYVKGGGIYSNFNLTYSLENQSRGISVKKYGISGGVGVSYRLCNSWGIFMEYETTKYPAMSIKLDARDKHEFKPSTYTFITGISYSF